MSDTKQIILPVPAEIKGAWIAASRAQGMKLGEWVVQRVGVMDYDYNGFSLNVAAFEPFERYVRALSDADALRLLRLLKAQDAAQSDAVAAIKIARSYLEKRVAIADGTADKELFHDINVDALGFFSARPELTHLQLVAVIAGL